MSFIKNLMKQNRFFVAEMNAISMETIQKNEDARSHKLRHQHYVNVASCFLSGQFLTRMKYESGRFPQGALIFAHAPRFLCDFVCSARENRSSLSAQIKSENSKSASLLTTLKLNFQFIIVWNSNRFSTCCLIDQFTILPKKL